jgi:protein tyrosine phosphatase (PTP) superfamily phosphohydrolase (DUF442 family)
LAAGVGGSYALWVYVHGGAPGSTPNKVRDEPLEAAAGHKWAQPLDCPGAPNFHRVSPGLYRGAQPTEEGFKQLKQMGVRTVVNLRKLHSDSDKLEHTGLAYERIDMNPLHPEDEDVVRFLRIVGDPARQPIFVHCQHGSDRTGMMCAVYRVAIEGWTKDEAIAEWTKGGFGFHDEFQNLINYFRRLDLNEMRRRAGVDTLPSTTRP